MTDSPRWVDIRDARHIADVICADLKGDETKDLLNYFVFSLDFRATEGAYIHMRFRAKRDNLIRCYVREGENDSTTHKRKLDDRYYLV